MSELYLGGTRYIVVYFSESVVVKDLDIMKLVLRKLEKGEFKWFLEDPGSDYYAYKFEVEIPPTLDEDEACQQAAIELIGVRLELAKYWEQRREEEDVLREALKSRYRALVNDDIYLHMFPSDSDGSLYEMTDTDEEDKGQEIEEAQENVDEKMKMDKQAGVSDGNGESPSLSSEFEEIDSKM